ncbi:MAG: hypothetical protein HWE14_02035 [Flavobacteriia bacterium]|nr:hypothetical protein [Flavobacteriia bacterium]
MSIGNGLFLHDSWHAVEVMLSSDEPFSGFFVQHGPHHLGVTYFLHELAYLFGAENSHFHAVVQVLILSVSAWFGFELLSKWRGRRSWFDLWLPIVFLNPLTLLNSATEPYLHSFTVLFGLWVAYLGFGYMKPVRLATLMFILFLSAFTFNANLVLIAAFFFYLIHWLKTRWYTSGIITLWSFFLLVLMYLTTDMSGVESTAAEGYNLGQWSIYVVRLVTSYFFVNPVRFMLIPGIIAFILMAYVVAHPWIRPRKWEHKEYGLWFLIAILLLYWTLNSITRWSLPEGNIYATRYFVMSPLVLFVLWVSFNLQRRWKKKMPLLGMVAITWSLYLNSVDYSFRRNRFNEALKIEEARMKLDVKHSEEVPCYLHGNPAGVQLDWTSRVLFPEFYSNDFGNYEGASTNEN